MSGYCSTAAELCVQSHSAALESLRPGCKQQGKGTAAAPVLLPLAQQQPSPCLKGGHATPSGHLSPGDPLGHCSILIPITVTHKSTWGGLSSGGHCSSGGLQGLSVILKSHYRERCGGISSVLTWQFFQQVPSK